MAYELPSSLTEASKTSWELASAAAPPAAAAAQQGGGSFLQDARAAWRRTLERVRNSCDCYGPPQTTPAAAAAAGRRRVAVSLELGPTVHEVAFDNYTTTFTWDGPEDSTSQGQCAVCLDVFLEGEEIRTLPCMHRFHLECIDKWLLKRPRCPTCKQSILQSILA